MEEQMQVDAPADSSPATDQAQPTPAGAQNTEQQPGQNGQPAPTQGQTVPYERLQQIAHQNQQFRTELAKAQGRIQQMEAQLKQNAQANGGQVSPEDAQSYQQAWTAMEKILMATPRGQKLLQMADQAEQLQGVSSNVKSMQEAQLRTMERQGVNRIHELADKEQLPKDKDSRSVFIKLVESLALTIPSARERFAAGDLTLLDEAFEKAKPLLAHIKREGQTQVLDTKNRTRQLPPASRGGAAGPAGLPKFDPNKDDPRAYQSALAKAATAMLNEKG